MGWGEVCDRVRCGVGWVQGEGWVWGFATRLHQRQYTCSTLWYSLHMAHVEYSCPFTCAIFQRLQISNSDPFQELQRILSTDLQLVIGRALHKA